MASFGKQFEVNNEKGKSKNECIKKGNCYRISVLTDRLVRLEYSKEGIFNDGLTELVANRDFDVPKFKVEEDDKYLVITTKYFSLQYMKEAPFKGPSFAPDVNLKVKLLNTDKVWYYNHPEARNFKANNFSLDDFKGNGIKLEDGLYSTDGFATMDDSKFLKIDNTGIVQKGDVDSIDLYLFMYKRDFGLCLKDYFSLTGYPTLIPRYALGLWWLRDRIYSYDDVIKLVSTFKENELPLHILLLNEFWHIKEDENINLYKTGFTFNKKLFPEPIQLTDFLHSQNIKLGLNIDPSEGVRRQEDAYNNMILEMGLKSETTIPFRAFDKMFIILYFEYLINPLKSLNVDFFWIDYKNNRDDLKALNYYHYKDFNLNEEKRPMLFSRNTGFGAHKTTVLYSGETIVSWNTLNYLPYYNSNASNMGLSWWSHDIGGYKGGTEDSELYIRYIQLGTFSPIFRLSAQRGIYYKREPWLWDFKTFNIAKNFIQLRHRLIPYIYSEAYVYHKMGMPLIQPLYYEYPEIYDELEYRNEYYFGSEFLISPITKPKDKVMDRVVKKVFLPKGIWYDFKTGKKFSKTKKYITFYKDEDYPVFVKAGSIIPMNVNFDNTLPKELEIQIFPGKNNTYFMYEDDGESNLYKDGYYIITAFDYTYNKDEYVLSVHPTEGKTKIIPDNRDYKFVFKNSNIPDNISVSLNQNKLEDDKYSFYKRNNDLIIEIKNVDTTGNLVIKCNGNNLEIESSQIVNDDINLIISDLKIPTKIKEQLARICFSNLDIKKKRIEIRKLKRKGLANQFVVMFIKLYDYLEEN